MDQSIGVSNFAAGRHFEEKGYTYTSLSQEELVALVKANWHTAKPGAGESDCTRKVLISVPPRNEKGELVFFTPYALLQEGMEFRGLVTRRQAGEDLYRDSYLLNPEGFQTEEVKFVKVVVYSKEALLENDGSCDTDCDWEIVTIIASPVEDEPMHPLAMARNYLEKVGGTKSEYTAQEFAEAIYYWSLRVKMAVKGGK